LPGLVFLCLLIRCKGEAYFDGQGHLSVINTLFKIVAKKSPFNDFYTCFEVFTDALIAGFAFFGAQANGHFTSCSKFGGVKRA
jgi:hypothetical protein